MTTPQGTQAKSPDLNTAVAAALLRESQLALHSKAQKASPSPPSEGGEGWGEEGHSSCGWPVRQQLDAPLPSPLPARSSRGEGVGAVANPAASSVAQTSRQASVPQCAPLPAIGSPAKARILVVEDNPFFREGISRLINRQPDLCCCGESDSVALIPAIAAREKPDLILLDVNLKDGESLQLIQPLLRSLPMTAILILSTSDEVHTAETALCAGALGYVVKHDSVAEILGAIRDVLRRKVFVSSALATRLAYKLIRS